MPVAIYGWIIRNLLKIIGIIVLLALILSAPHIITLIQRLAETPRQITATLILERIQALSDLSSVRYNFSSIVTTTREVPGILGALYGENQAMVAVGHVRAGIDLSQMKEEDVIRGQDVLLLKLPPPTLQDCFLSENDSYVVSRQTGIFARGSLDLDSSARSFAVIQFRDAAIRENILEEANINAKAAIEGFLKLVEPENVRIEVVTLPPDPNAPFPETCM